MIAAVDRWYNSLSPTRQKLFTAVTFFGTPIALITIVHYL